MFQCEPFYPTRNRKTIWYNVGQRRLSFVIRKIRSLSDDRPMVRHLTFDRWFCTPADFRSFVALWGDVCFMTRGRRHRASLRCAAIRLFTHKGLQHLCERFNPIVR